MLDLFDWLMNEEIHLQSNEISLMLTNWTGNPHQKQSNIDPLSNRKNVDQSNRMK